MTDYGNPEYWERRYKEKQSTFDWLESYKSLQFIIKELITPESRVLVLGCGNAAFSEDMYDDGYKYIDNCDISGTVIEQMRERSADRKEMTYEVMDVRDLKYGSEKYDLAVDKSTIDALLCGNDAYYNVALMTKARTL
eukprot:TRINITY_DN2385_c0_g1_i3.p1 TRINITY_DN2385_c0_g1~~TRINITY_DN2385_c0_g1_i3.p1  ORF type:complete len:138 (+),score=44.41 TRINITY_DN2385_c0_g1_i3:149-562(+)